MIEIKNISLSLSGREILTDFSLYVKTGTVHIILGPSGAGKSTVLKAILGLISVDKGSVKIDGAEIAHLNESQLLEIRRKIGVVFQGNALFDSLTVAENTAYFLSHFSNLSKDEVEKKIEEILSFVNLKGTNNLYPDELSGGMKKRLAVARALATDPKIVLFDEPTTGLDPINSKAVLELIHSLKRIGTTCVIVTHILNDAILIGDVLTVINKGKTVVTGTLEEILSSGNKFLQDFFYELNNERVLLTND